MRRVFRLAVVGLLCLTTGCATIVSSSNWPVMITSNPTGSRITVKNSSGIPIHTGTTPMTVMLKSGDGFFNSADYMIEVEGGGTMPLSASLNGWYAGNLIFGGLIGLVIVDPLTGAMWRLPEQVIVQGPTGLQ